MGFFAADTKPAAVQYHAVIDRFPVPVPMDPIAAAIFTAAFVAVLLAAYRRPAYGVAALCFTAPLAFYHDVFSTSVTFAKVVLVALACATALRPGALRALRIQPGLAVIAAGAAIIAGIALSGLHAEFRAPVAREALKWIEYVAAIAVVIAAYRLDPDDAVIRRAWFASIAIVCASALVEEIVSAPSGLRAGPGIVPRIAGVLEGPNQLAGYLETGIALLAVWSITRNGRIAKTLLAVAIVTLALTFSRSGAFGAAVAIAVVAATYRKRAVALLAPVFAGIAAGVAADASWLIAARTLPALRATESGAGLAGGVGNRSELWRAAIAFFRAHPLLGIGAGNYEFELPRAGLADVRTHANNWYLQQLAEGGIVLFGATIAFIAAVVTPLIRFARSSPWSAAALAATAALCVHQLADYIVFYPKAGLPWMLAIALGIASAAPQLHRCD